MDVIQLLPLNDSGTDPSPYNCLSSVAINPIYLSLDRLPLMEQEDPLQRKLDELKHLNTSPRVLLEETQSHKLNFLHSYFEKYGKKLCRSKAFRSYVKKNVWVTPYALFKVLKDKLAQNNFQSWPSELKYPSKKKLKELLEIHAEEISFYQLLQYLCFLQLTEVKRYGHSQGVYLKGDIPILVNPDSADVWHEPDLFHLDFSAGAPPDTYNKEGQYWGFPIFNWEAMKKKHYAWWKERLHYASHLYDIYRIDHVIGFFRIWAIPLHRPSSEGSFIPADKNLWSIQGKEILQMLISSSSMLPIAEDLGVVPDMVRPMLQKLGICSTKVMRWERMWKEDSRFIPIDEYPPISLTCVSTHDSETLTLWWRDSPQEAKAYAELKQWDYTPLLSLPQRKKILQDSNHTSSLFHINLLQEYLALFPELISSHPEEERINRPGTFSPNNWTYRFRPSLEEMLSHDNLKQAILTSVITA